MFRQSLYAVLAAALIWTQMSWSESQSSAYENEEEELRLKFVYIMSCPSVQQSIPKSFNWEQCV